MTVPDVQLVLETPAEALVVEAVEQNQEPKTFTAEYVAELRKEAAKHRTEAAKLKAKQDEREAAKLSDVERLGKEVDALKQERDSLLSRQKQAAVRAEVQKAIAKIGVADTDLALTLLPTDDLDLEDEALDKEVEKRMRALLAKYPVLAKAPNLSPTNGGATGNKQAMVFTKAQLNDHAFFQKHKAEIMLASREGRIVDQ